MSFNNHAAMDNDVEPKRPPTAVDDEESTNKEPRVGISKLLSTRSRAEAEEATAAAIEHIEEEYTIDSDNSPVPEVRANVPNTDDVHLPVSTFRMWFLGILFTM